MIILGVMMVVEIMMNGDEDIIVVIAMDLYIHVCKHICQYS